MEKVEFIESYVKEPGGDYQWNDNHGELVRCKDCMWRQENGRCYNERVHFGEYRTDDWFCADGKR